MGVGVSRGSPVGTNKFESRGREVFFWDEEWGFVIKKSFWVSPCLFLVFGSVHLPFFCSKRPRRARNK